MAQVFDIMSGKDIIFYHILTTLSCSGPLNVLIPEFGLILFSTLFSSYKKDEFDEDKLVHFEKLPTSFSDSVSLRMPGQGGQHTACPCHLDVKVFQVEEVTGQWATSQDHRTPTPALVPCAAPATASRKTCRTHLRTSWAAGNGNHG